MKSAKSFLTTNIFWIVLFSALAFASIIAILIIMYSGNSGKIARIYSDNELVKTVSLEKEDEFTIKNENGYNIIRVTNGKISVIESDCKNQICVNQGEIDNDLIPIVCVPNGIVIRVESGIKKSDYDAEVR